MRGEHLAQVLQIERNTQVSPWSRLAFEESITRSENTNKQVAHLARVLLLEDAVQGFHIVSSVLDETHILNLAVDPIWQGHGLGHAVLQDITEQAEGYGSKRIFLEVRSSNEVAQSLYQKWQFRQIAERKDYYRTPDLQREDALIMVRELQID